MKIKDTLIFNKQLKRLARKHRSILEDVAVLAEKLSDEPYQGQSIGRSCYKVRMAITSKGKGKSGGSRVITCIKIERDTIFLLAIYDKSEQEDINDNDLTEFLMQIE